MTMIDLSSIFQKDPMMVSRQVVGEVILVPIRQNVGDLESIYTLNETAARAWDLVDGQRSVAKIADQIAVEFDVEGEQAQHDLLELFAQLKTIQAVKEI